MKVGDTLKGAPRWHPGAIVTAEPYNGDLVSAPFHLPEHLVPSQRYIVLPRYDATDDLLPLLDRCSVLLDTPENRRELATGFQMNDTLRREEYTWELPRR